jgi:hypothetical protein
MMDYFTRMEYSNLNPENGEPLWKALSAELKKEVTKELSHAKKLKKTKDSKKIIPSLSTFKIYVEEALVILDFDREEEEVTTKKNVKIQEPVRLEPQEDAFRREMETRKREAQPYPRFTSPNFPKGRMRAGPLECYYCKKRHTIPDCEDFARD